MTGFFLPSIIWDTFRLLHIAIVCSFNSYIVSIINILQLTHSTFEGHLGSLHFLVNSYNVAKSILVHASWDIYLRVNCMPVYDLANNYIYQLFTAECETSCCSISSITFGIVRHFSDMIYYFSSDF